MTDSPLLVDPISPSVNESGRCSYFRPEGYQFICGVGPKIQDDYDVDAADAHAFAASLVVTDDDHRTLFEDTLWPALAHRVQVRSSIALSL
jgi:hypothetical protein